MLSQAREVVFAMAQTPHLASKLSKAILLSKTTKARKARNFCCQVTALAVHAMVVARVKEHCLPMHEQREKPCCEKAKGIKILYWR